MTKIYANGVCKDGQYGLVVDEADMVEGLCEEYIMWWDGSLFHWF